MKKIVVDGVDIFNPLQDDKKNKVIEYFVQYYGEKYRDRITQRINDAAICFVGKLGGWVKPSDSLRTYYNNKKNDLLKQFYSNYVGKEAANEFLYIEPNQLKTILNEEFKKITFAAVDLVGKLYFKEKGLDYDDDLKYRTVVEFLKDEKKYQMFKHDLKKMVNLWDKKYASSFEKLSHEEDIYLSELKDIEDKYFKEKNKNNEILFDLTAQYIAKLTKINPMDFKSDVKCQRMVYVFLDIMERKGEFISPHARILYVELFNFLGVHKGKDYQNYKDDPQLLKIFCNEKYLREYGEIIQSFAQNSTENCEYYLSLVEKIKETGIDDINNAISSAYNFIFQSFSNTQAFVLTALKDGQLKPVCVFPDYLDLSNATAVHELNHIVEMDVIEEDGEKCRKCGFEAFAFYGEKERYSFKKMLKHAEEPTEKLGRQFESLNEIVNDYFAMDITKLLEKDNFNIGICEDSQTVYSKGFILFEDFIEKHKKDIIECRLSDDRLYFANKIGKKNFKDLALLAREYLKIDNDEIEYIYREICDTLGIKKEDLGEYLRHGDLNKDWPSDCEVVIESFKKLREIENKIDTKRLSIIDEKDVAYEDERC